MNALGKIAYGFAFAVVLPAALALWAIRLDSVVALPAVQHWTMGIALVTAALVLMVTAVVDLRIHGRGWPMSPYPPEARVSRGAYAIVNHPLYVGSVLLSAGVALMTGSAAALWIVTPFLAICCAAFVIGFESESTIRRFGPRQSAPWIRVPAGAGPAQTADRLSIYLLVFLPWFLTVNGADTLARLCDPRRGCSRRDTSIPIVPWTEAVYALDYVFVLAVPLILRTRRQLFDFAADACVAIVFVTLVYLAFPVFVPPREAPADSLFTPLMLWERSFDTPAAALPSFHVVWAAIAAMAYGRVVPRLRWLWWSIAVAIAVSCMTTGMHAIVDVAAGAVASGIILSWRRIANALRLGAELLANSWREWDLGGLRLMSHGLYAALGSFLGILIVAKLTGHAAAAAMVGASIIIGAALWAQLLEGSPQLLRPFGYFGGVIGGCVGVLFTDDPWLILGAYAVAAPVIQACGRLRCLVQGCCHGRPTDPAIGIRYTHPRSRVSRLSDLAAKPVHATQLYSIVANAVQFVLLLSLWTTGASLQFLCGSYFILSGVARFVE